MYVNDKLVCDNSNNDFIVDKNKIIYMDEKEKLFGIQYLYDASKPMNLKLKCLQVLNMLGGIDQNDDGQIIIGGKDLSAMNNKELTLYRRYDIGFVFQFYNLIQNLTAKENVEIASQICKEPMDAEEALRSVGLEDRMDNFPSQLSGGEQQRVAIARALAKRPKLLLCDEPTGALDYQTGKNILKLLQETCRKENMTVVLVTHNQAITPMADRVIRVKNSKVESMVINKKLTSIDDIEW